MKKLFIAIAFLFLGANIYSQNLQFSQVLLLSTAQTGSNILLGTVPAGKVWKIEAFGTTADYYYRCGFSFNGTNAFISTGGVDNYSAGYTYNVDNESVWLPAGTPVWALSCNYHRWLSIIEFNIVP
jgi:hypothetical protein